MYQQHIDFESPENENAKIWQYMDFAKFVSLLDTEALYFSRSDMFEDKYEGVYPKADKEIFKDRDASIKHTKRKQKRMYINCWHINEYESAAMWKIYSTMNQGVAIQSTFSRLKKSFDQYKHTIYIGKVKYIDLDKDLFFDKRRENGELATGDELGHIKGACVEDAWERPYIPFLHKRKSFEHEEELRAILSEISSRRVAGTPVNVDLNELIESIYILPTAEKWIYELVKAITRKNTKIRDKKVIKSKLYDPK